MTKANKKLVDLSPSTTVALRTNGQSLTLWVFEALRAEILDCRLQPGTKLRIAEIATRFDVSNAAVREALSRLVADGLVEARDQRGFRVTPLSLDDLKDITSTRIELESIALRRSIQFGDATWESGILATFHELSRATPPKMLRLSDVPPDWQSLHSRFHRALISACRSEWLLRFCDRLTEQSQRYRSLSVVFATSVRDLEKEHRDIMTATIDRDADAAVRRLSKHFRMTADIIINAQKHAGDEIYRHPRGMSDVMSANR